MTPITTDIFAVDLALYIPSIATAVMSDFHFGYEESLTRQGLLVPRQQFRRTMERLEYIFTRIKPRIIVLNGDLKHEFGHITRQEWNDTTKLIEYLLQRCEKLIIVKGNHDVILGPIASRKIIELVKEYRDGTYLIVHGDEIPTLSGVKTIIIGHDHPAITLRDKGKYEKFKCFLKGPYKRRILIATPAFNVLTEGSDIMKEHTLSPFLQGSLSDFEVWAIPEAEKVLYFGRLRNLV